MDWKRRRREVAFIASLWLQLTLVFGDAELSVQRNRGAIKGYDGVGVQRIPRPAKKKRRTKPEAVLTTMGPLASIRPADNASAEPEFQTYARLSDRPFVSGHVRRIRATCKKRIAKEIRDQADDWIEEEFEAGVAMSYREYRDWLEKIGKIGHWNEPEPWQFQYRQENLHSLSRYDQSWDDMRLVVWGPLTVTDRGSIDVDTSLSGLQKFWKSDLKQVEVIPAPPEEKPRERLVGKSVRFDYDFKLRISSSRLFDTVYKVSSRDWANSFIEAARYAQVKIGIDFCTDILKRKYLQSDLECRLYRDGRWIGFLNVKLIGR